MNTVLLKGYIVVFCCPWLADGQTLTEDRGHVGGWGGDDDDARALNRGAFTPDTEKTTMNTKSQVNTRRAENVIFLCNPFFVGNPPPTRHGASLSSSSFPLRLKMSAAAHDRAPRWGLST